MITKIDSNGTKYSYEYDYLNPTKLLCAKNSLGNKYNFKCDEKGNLTSTALTENTLISSDITDLSSYYFRFANSEQVFNKRIDQNGKQYLNIDYFNGKDTQTFLVRASTKLEEYKIYAEYSTKALTVPNASDNLVTIEETNNLSNQNWNFNKQSDGSYKITNVERGNDYCLTLDEEKNSIKLEKDEGKLSQRIYVYENSEKNRADLFNNLLIESNEIYRIKAKNSKLYLQGTENGDVIQNTYEKDNISQLWRVTTLYENLYKISNLSSSQGYTITAFGDDIKLYNDIEPNREWEIYRKGNNTYKIKLRLYEYSEKNVLAIENNSLEPQSKTIISAESDTGNNDFIFEKANMLNIDESHYYRIKVKCSDLYLGVSSDMTVEQQEADSNNEGQKWIIKNLDDGFYQITSATNDMKTMQVENYDEPSLSIKIGENGVNDAFEIIARNDGTYCIKPSIYQEYFAFDISGASTQPGVDVSLWESNDTAAQKFYIEEAGKYDNGNIKKYIESTAEYSSNGKYQTKSTDEIDNVTNYTYNDSTGMISVEETDYNKFEYTYDNFDRIIKVELKDFDQLVSKNEYTYENDRLKTITAGDTTYEFIYDEFGNTKQVKIGNQEIITHNYDSNNGNLNSENFANNQVTSYEYDRFNRLTKKQGTNGSYTYTYNADSNVKTIVDTINNNTKNFTYDLAQRLVKEINSNGFTTEYEYDINNNVNNIKYSLNNNEKNVKYNFDNYNRLNSVVDSNSMWKKQTDTLSRINKNTITNGTSYYETSYDYLNIAGQDKKTTTYVSKITNQNNIPIEYEYYSNGNIKTIKSGNDITNYYYDAGNMLTREDNKALNKTITYTYDFNGNILNKKEYEYTTTELFDKTPTATITYEYTNQNWKDQLTNYNGKVITYDEIGNPLTYSGNTYTWQNGRQLAGISNNNQTITYKYNENGIRTQKTLNGTVTNYYLDGTKVIYEQTENNIIYYIYDENGNILGLNYNGTQYYYIKNAQNDVIGILNNNLSQVVSYTYDSWGNIVSIKDSNGNEITDSTSIGIINPYRYRSYRYDDEIGLYYLQSRYYNPEWGRYINADNLVQTGQGMLDKNMYAYCENNPINRVDPDGKFWQEIGNFFKGVVNSIAGFFGASSQVSVQKEIDFSSTPVYSPVSVETGVTANTVTSRKGNSSKPVSVYANGVSNNPLSSTAGLKVNIGKSSLELGVGLDNTALKFSIANGDVTTNTALKMDITKLQIGIEAEVETRITENIYESTYAYTSINGGIAGAIYMFVSTGNWNSSLQPAY